MKKTKYSDTMSEEMREQYISALKDESAAEVITKEIHPPKKQRKSKRH